MLPRCLSARTAAVLVATLVGLAVRASAAQVVPRPRRDDSLEAMAEQLDQMQRELDALRQRDHERQAWEASIVNRLPEVSEDDAEEDEAEDAEDGDDADDLIKLLTPVVGDCGNITFKPGLRIQPRYLYDDLTNNHDFFIRRFRMKMAGNAYKLADYGLELKVDSNGRIDTDHTPDPVVENAWLDFPLEHMGTCLRVGLYDAPFSRNALTSDSKLLLMDRSLIFDELAAYGLADNTIGLMLHQRPLGGHLEYAVGIFDNIRFERFTGIPAVTKDSRDLMPAGRVVWHVFDPAGSTDGCLDCGYADYRASYIGQGRRLAFGANVEQLSNCVDTAVPTEFDLFAWGVDVFFNSGPVVFEAEYDEFTRNVLGAGPDIVGNGWYAQAGYLLNYCQYLNCPCTWGWEAVARYQELDRSDLVDGDRLSWTSVGLNVYIRDHNLKVQTDYTFKREEGVELKNDTFQVQLQFDY